MSSCHSSVYGYWLLMVVASQTTPFKTHIKETLNNTDNKKMRAYYITCLAHFFIIVSFCSFLLFFVCKLSLLQLSLIARDRNSDCRHFEEGKKMKEDAS